MTTDDLKAAIERVKNSDTSEITHADFTTVLALAEIGRLAVEARLCQCVSTKPLVIGHELEVWYQRREAAAHAASDAVTAFLAGRGT